jgi:tetratricopeptide (TPR) repeat protein
MAEISYLDFDLLIERSAKKYRARVLNSPAGQAAIDFRLPFSDPELDKFLSGSPEMEAAKSFGERLFNAVFGGEVGVGLRRSLDEASRQGAGLRLRLRLTEVPELADLPWEFLYNSALNRFLVLSVETPLVRYLDLPERIQPLAVKPPLRVLAMISSPSDYPKLDVEQEWTKLRDALGDLEQRSLVVLERLEETTLAALQRKLRQAEYHIFHFIGHGGFDEQAQDGVLVLEDEAKRGRQVSGQYLGTLLHDHRPLRLVILNACEGARTSRTDPFAGTAQSLVQQGIPAVIAMQFAITDEAAITFAHEFYCAVADGYPVDAALAESRKAISVQGNDIEWGTPVLYMRAPDGRIFDVERLSDEEQKRAQIAALFREAQAAMTGEDWAVSSAKLQALLALDPTHAEAAAMLSRARQQQELISLYTKGREHYDAGHWREALDYFRRVQEIGGNYKGVYALMATIQHEITKAEAVPAQPTPPVQMPAAGHIPDSLDTHYKMVIKAITDGRLVPFLGAGMNLCGRPAGIAWRRGQYLPSGGELAAYLAENFGYPAGEVQDLVRVSQYVAVVTGSGPLYEELHSLLDADYPPTPLHQFLATLPAVLREKGYILENGYIREKNYNPRYQLIVTTNYDDVLERTFRAAGEPFDLVTYVAEGEQRGKFLHWPPDGEARLIEKPNEYRDLSLDQRTVILKIHGAVDRANPERDSYVITEDHYIDYLTRTDISSLIPVKLAAKLRKSHFLFLGYSLRDWNLRVILHRIWGEQKLTYKSWAIQLDPQPLDQEFWRTRDVDILNVCLEDYVVALSEQLQALPLAGGGV